MEGEQKTNDFLVALDQALSKASFKDVQAFVKLLDDSGTRTREGDSNWNSLRYQDPFYIRVLVYFAARGSGRYTVDQVVKDIHLYDDKKKEFNFGHGWVNRVLCWARDKGILGVKFEVPKSYPEKDRTPIEIDVGPLFYKFGFPESRKEEEKHEL